VLRPVIVAAGALDVPVAGDGDDHLLFGDQVLHRHVAVEAVQDAQLRADDVVEHFFVTTTHHWLLFFTTKGRVYRCKAYEVPEAGRDAKGQHVANLLALQPGEEIAQILDIRDYKVAQYLVLATRDGKIRMSSVSSTSSALTSSSPPSASSCPRRRIAMIPPWRLVSYSLSAVFLLRFTATDDSLRPMGRSTEGVKGMSFREGDTLLSASGPPRR
jgi:DNA gyrase subunit A